MQALEPHRDHVAITAVPTDAEARAAPAATDGTVAHTVVGAGPTMFVLAPERERLSGLDPTADEVIEAHADAVCRLLLGGC